MTTRDTKRREQHDTGRAVLLDAAEQVFGRRGYHDATLKEVAELAELSVGSVYSYFDNKDDLFLSVYARRGSAFVDGLRDIVRAARPPVDRLRDVAAFTVGFFRDHPHFGRLYLRTSSVGSPLPGSPGDDDFRDGLDRAMRLQAEVFADGQRAGTIRAGDTLVLARILSGVVLAYMAVDPGIGGDAGTDALPLTDLQQMIEEMFRG